MVQGLSVLVHFWQGLKFVVFSQAWNKTSTKNEIRAIYYVKYTYDNNWKMSSHSSNMLMSVFKTFG